VAAGFQPAEQQWPQVFNLRVSTSGAALVQVENLHPLSQLKTCTHFLS
jgi:hypothetical protein